MMKKWGAVSLTLVCGLSLSACATVTRGTNENFFVLSEPDGADVSMTNGQTCKTPCTVKLKRKSEFDVTVSMPGYKSKTVKIESKMAGGGAVAGAGNLLAGGVIGGILDGSNGSMKDLKPNPLKVILAAEGSANESQVVAADKPKAAKKSKKN
jgi:PEGA domain